MLRKLQILSAMAFNANLVLVGCFHSESKEPTEIPASQEETQQKELATPQDSQAKEPAVDPALEKGPPLNQDQMPIDQAKQTQNESEPAPATNYQVTAPQDLLLPEGDTELDPSNKDVPIFPTLREMLSPPSKKKEQVSKEAKHQVYLSGYYYRPIKEEADSSAGFNLSWQYSAVKSVSYSASQAIGKAFYIEQYEDEFKLQDTVLSYSYTPENQTGLMQESFGGSFTLPLSKYSQENEIYTKLSVHYGLSRSFLSNEALNVSLGGSFTYHVNKYETAHEDYGGVALPLFGAIGNTSVAYTLTENLSSGISASYGEVYSTNTEDDQSDYLRVIADHPYAISAFVDYSFWENFSAGLAYSQSNIFEQYGQINFFLYDHEASIISTSLGYSRSF